MAKKKTPGGTAGKGGVNPAPTRDDQTVRIAAEQLTMVPIDDLIPYANNAKKHGVKQINQIRASLREFGFVTPVLIDFDNNIIAGHGRVEAARAEGMIWFNRSPPTMACTPFSPMFALARHSRQASRSSAASACS